jgi:geranylgeranyl diphosphate synthase, type I
MELAKDFIQLQDDVIDNDPVRRERAAAWQAFGVGPALLGADALRHQAMEVLARHRPHGLAAVWHLQETLGRVVAGQARDLSFEERPWSGTRRVTPAEYRAMATMKTSPLFECVLSLGAVLHGAPSALVNDLINAGRSFGLACQALDDILDLWGSADPRDNFNDLRQGKKTLPVLAALATDTTAARQLERLLERLPDEPHQLERLQEAADLIETAGGRFVAEQQARRHYQAAVAGLSALPLPEQRRTELITVSSLFGLRGENQTIMVGSV